MALLFSKKMELIKKRALRFLLNDWKSSYDVLLATSNRSTTLTLSRMRYVAVFKCLHGLNPKYVSQLFERKDIQYGLKEYSTHILV